jgi:hypothetical protein
MIEARTCRLGAIKNVSSLGTHRNDLLKARLLMDVSNLKNKKMSARRIRFKNDIANHTTLYKKGTICVCQDSPDLSGFVPPFT